MAAARKKIDKAALQNIFNELDLDNNGVLDEKEFEEAMVEIGLSNDEVDKAFSIVSGIKRRRKWGDMSHGVRGHWKTLGWSDASWGGTSTSETDGKKWDQLTGTQKEAATSLGYASDVWNSHQSHESNVRGITFPMLVDAIKSASELQVTMTRVLTRQLTMSDKRNKIDQIRELMAQREPGRRKNADRITQIRSQRLSARRTESKPPPKQVDSVDSEDSDRKRRQVDRLKLQYGIQ